MYRYYYINMFYNWMVLSSDGLETSTQGHIGLTGIFKAPTFKPIVQVRVSAFSYGSLVRCRVGR